MSTKINVLSCEVKTTYKKKDGTEATIYLVKTQDKQYDSFEKWETGEQEVVIKPNANPQYNDSISKPRQGKPWGGGGKKDLGPKEIRMKCIEQANAYMIHRKKNNPEEMKGDYVIDLAKRFEAYVNG